MVSRLLPSPTTVCRLALRLSSHSYEDATIWSDDLASDQKEIVLRIMSKLKEWLEWDGVTSFQPLRLTVTGKPGTGKSVIIKTFQSICYHMFHTHDCVQVCVPTGGAAYNTGGQTCHRQWGISHTPLKEELSSEKKYL